LTKLSPLKVIALFCGIPAAGKSRFVQSLFKILAQSGGDRRSVSCVTFDEFLSAVTDEDDRSSASESRHVYTEEEDIANDDDEDDDDEDEIAMKIDGYKEQKHGRPSTLWHASRQAALNRVETLINDDDSVQIILVDDNFWLRSMRREIYRIARDARPPIIASFISFLVTAEIEQAILRDALRPERLSSSLESSLHVLKSRQHGDTFVDSYRVGETTIRKMATSFQSPLIMSRSSDTKKGGSHWDSRHCYQSPIDADTRIEDIAELLESIACGANKAFIPRQPQLSRTFLEKEAAEAPVDAVALLNKLISAAKEKSESILRALVAGKMQSFTRGSDSSSANRTRLGKILAAAKKDVSDDIKESLLHIHVTKQTRLREVEEAILVILEGIQTRFESKVRFD